MTHPEELLAGHVDGTLSAKERLAVDAHLAGCPRCSREIALATGARAALRSLAEEPAPSGVATRALEEVGSSRRSSVGGGTPRWYRVGGIVAAAAGLLVLALVLPRIGQDQRASGDARAQGQESAQVSGAASALAASVIEIRKVNYDDASLTSLASSYKTSGESAVDTKPPVAAAFGTQAQTAKALECIARSAPDEPGDLQSLIRARFKSTPAYLAVFLEGPGAGQPADAVTVWVFATTDCRILSFSSAQL